MGRKRTTYRHTYNRLRRPTQAMSELADPPLAGVPAADLPAIDYRSAFEQAPVGLVLSRHRAIVDCNQAVAAMFRVPREALG